MDMGNRKYGFTLIELMVVVVIIIIITSFLVTVPPKMEEKAKIAKTRYLLKNIADGIKSFEEDWGMIPPTTGHLINVAKIKELATEKGINLGAPEPYLTNVPEYFYGVYQKGAFHCPLYDPYIDSVLHAHNMQIDDVNVSVGGAKDPFGYTTCNSAPWAEPGYVGGCTETVVNTPIYAPPGPFEGYNVASSETFIADDFGVLVYYFRDLDKGSYILISQGPDKSCSITFHEYMEYLYNGKSLSYTPDNNKDKDNIIYSSS